MSKAFFMLFSCLLAGTCFVATPEDKVPSELGSVKWNRDYAAAKQSSQQSGKPLMLLFQEVPG